LDFDDRLGSTSHSYSGREIVDMTDSLSLSSAWRLQSTLHPMEADVQLKMVAWFVAALCIALSPGSASAQGDLS